MGSHLHVVCVCVCVIVRRVETRENDVPVTLNDHQPDKMMETPILVLTKLAG